LWSIAAAGATVLVVDHDLETVDQHYDRVIRLEDGRVEESG
jgi:ABC-type ATPase involved in cell division